MTNASKPSTVFIPAATMNYNSSDTSTGKALCLAYNGRENWAKFKRSNNSTGQTTNSDLYEKETFDSRDDRGYGHSFARTFRGRRVGGRHTGATRHAKSSLQRHAPHVQPTGRCRQGHCRVWCLRVYRQPCLAA